MQFAGRPVEDDVSAGAWIASTLRPFGEHVVGSLVPPVFDGYVRVFHPAVRYPEDDDWLADDEPGTPLAPDEDVTWAEVAAFNGRAVHPAMEWASITGAWAYRDSDDQPGVWNQAPADGHLPASVAERLADVLARHTSTPEDCWFGVWAGLGWVGGSGPTLDLPGRTFWLIRGPAALAAANLADEPAEQSAHLFWPADRAWYVATDIDLMTTYVGASAACITELLASDGLEAVAVPADQGTTWDTDTINPLPMDAPG